MYSYFVFLSMNDGTFIQLNVATALRPQDIAVWCEEFFKAVDSRLKELRKTERCKDAFRWRVLLDPAHEDPIASGEGRRMKGTFKLSGEFPGRKSNSPI
jgi:hypothetical protein